MEEGGGGRVPSRSQRFSHGVAGRITRWKRVSSIRSGSLARTRTPFSM